MRDTTCTGPAIAIVFRTHAWLGLAALVAAVLVAGLWVPLDTASGLTERVRRKVEIGDAMAPVVAAAFLGLGGLLLLLPERNVPDQPRPGRDELVFLAKTACILLVSMDLLRWSGPFAVALANLLTAEALEYRLLRDTVPWKYIGFALGGFVMVAGLAALCEGHLTRRAAIAAAIVVLVLAALVDLPFEDLLLPPNGDV